MLKFLSALVLILCVQPALASPGEDLVKSIKPVVVKKDARSPSSTCLSGDVARFDEIIAMKEFYHCAPAELDAIKQLLNAAEDKALEAIKQPGLEGTLGYALLGATRSTYLLMKQHR